MDYKSYLQSNYWINRRKKFKNKTHNRCFICRSKSNLQVHHKRYSVNGKSILFKEKHTDLRLLCRDCHSKIHKYNLEKIFASGLVKRRVLRDFLKS